MIKIPTVEGDLGADDHAVNMITTMTTIWLKQQQHDYNDNNMITVTTTWELQERQQYDHNHNTCWGCTDTCPCIWTGGSWTGTGKPVRPVFIVVMTIIMMISMLITMRALWQCWLIGTVKPMVITIIKDMITINWLQCLQRTNQLVLYCGGHDDDDHGHVGYNYISRRIWTSRPLDISYLCNVSQ